MKTFCKFFGASSVMFSPEDAKCCLPEILLVNTSAWLHCTHDAENSIYTAWNEQVGLLTNIPTGSVHGSGAADARLYGGADTSQCPAGPQPLQDPLWDHLWRVVQPRRLHHAGVPWLAATQPPPQSPKGNSSRACERQRNSAGDRQAGII